MTKNYSQFSSYFKPGFFLVFFLFFSFNGFGQSLSKPTVSGTPGCNGGKLTVGFTATLGWGGNFGSKTTYFIDLKSSTGNSVFTDSFNSNKSTAIWPPSEWAIDLSKSITLPSNIPSETSYTIVVRSTDPNATSVVSDPFSIGVSPPALTTNGPLCTGETLELTASNINGATYNWTGPNGYTATGRTPSRSNVNAAMAGTYTVTAMVNGCTSSSVSSNIVINNKPTPTITSNSPICEGATLQLTASNISNATYSWTGPNGYTSTGRTPSRINVTAAMAGIYTVTATVNGCTSEAATTNIVVNPIPSITGTTPGSRCGPGIVDLKATASAGTINWYAAPTGGSSLGTGPSFTTPNISSTATYYVDATSNGCTTGSRTPVVATIKTVPTITGTTPGSRCGPGTVDLEPPLLQEQLTGMQLQQEDLV